jgi:hypothetical protein
MPGETVREGRLRLPSYCQQTGAREGGLDPTLAVRENVRTSLNKALEEVEEEEDEHIYHGKGWCRESWIKSFGMKAVLPPPQEQKGR